MILKELAKSYAKAMSENYQKINKKMLVCGEAIEKITNDFKEGLIEMAMGKSFVCKYCKKQFYSELGKFCPNCARFQ